MGVIKVWDVVKDTTEGLPIWRSTLREELEHHRTRVNEIVYGDGHLWSGKQSRTLCQAANPADHAASSLPILSFCG